MLDPFSGLGTYEPVYENVRVPDYNTFESDPSKCQQIFLTIIDGNVRLESAATRGEN